MLTSDPTFTAHFVDEARHKADHVGLNLGHFLFVKAALYVKAVTFRDAEQIKIMYTISLNC